jgi:hypothetical protein
MSEWENEIKNENNNNDLNSNKRIPFLTNSSIHSTYHTFSKNNIQIIFPNMLYKIEINFKMKKNLTIQFIQASLTIS